MRMSVLPTYLFMHHMQTWWLQRPEEGVVSLGTGVPDSCECWGPNSGPLQGQQALSSNLDFTT